MGTVRGRQSASTTGSIPDGLGQNSSSDERRQQLSNHEQGRKAAQDWENLETSLYATARVVL
jgi:hypothetical protein